MTREDYMQALTVRHGKEVQERIAKAKIAVCGLGGLGSNIAISLARCGVGTLHLIDFDVVDITNLNRQQYQVSHLGMNKTDALEQQLREINPYVELKTDCVRLGEENITGYLKEEDYICEAFDDPVQKAILTNTVLEQLPDKFLVGASGMAGYGRSNEIQTKRIAKNYYLCGDFVSENSKEMGLMAPRVMICAAHQANCILENIISKHNI